MITDVTKDVSSFSSNHFIIPTRERFINLVILRCVIYQSRAI
jgi:hypothetical protein